MIASCIQFSVCLPLRRSLAPRSNPMRLDSTEQNRSDANREQEVPLRTASDSAARLQCSAAQCSRQKCARGESTRKEHLQRRWARIAYTDPASSNTARRSQHTGEQFCTWRQARRERSYTCSSRTRSHKWPLGADEELSVSLMYRLSTHIHTPARPPATHTYTYIYMRTHRHTDTHTQSARESRG